MSQLLLILGAGFLAGMMNAIAGGGSFVSFPALVFAGIPPVIANASSTVALLPGTAASLWAYRRELQPLEGISYMELALISLAGGLTGAVLLVMMPSSAFEAVVPWLLLGATIVFILGPRPALWLRERLHIGRYAVRVVQFVLAIYGGYFGGAVGLMMLASWSLLTTQDLKSLTAVRVLAVGVMNGIAAAYFVLTGNVHAEAVLVMLIAAAAGGYSGAMLVKHMSLKILRAMIIAISVTATVVFFIRNFR